MHQFGFYMYSYIQSVFIKRKFCSVEVYLTICFPSPHCRKSVTCGCHKNHKISTSTFSIVHVFSTCRLESLCHNLSRSGPVLLHVETHSPASLRVKKTYKNGGNQTVPASLHGTDRNPNL
jgi:hypothetical protein